MPPQPGWGKAPLCSRQQDGILASHHSLGIPHHFNQPLLTAYRQIHRGATPTARKKGIDIAEITAR